MTFLIEALSPEPFKQFFAMTDAELSAIGARRCKVTEDASTPCRVSLADAAVGETVLLVNHTHQPAKTPYHARHAIFVRQNVDQYHPEAGEVPKALSARLMSVRGFDADHMMQTADVVQGAALTQTITAFFADQRIAYIHLHNAKPGCYAACVRRA